MQLELVEALVVGRVGELVHAAHEAVAIGDLVGDREQALVDPSLLRQVEVGRELQHRPVGDDDPAVAVGERDAVDGPVNQAAHQRRVAAELLLALLLLRDVDDEALPVRAVAVGDEGGRVAYPDGVAVRATQAVVAAEGSPRGDRLGVAGEDAVAIARIEHAAPEPCLLEPVVHRIPEQRLDLRADVRESVAVLDVHHERQLLDEAFAAPLALPQLLAGETHTEADQAKRRAAPGDEERRDVEAVACGRAEKESEGRERREQARARADLEGEQGDPGQQH
jgi:hypothetical protein